MTSLLGTIKQSTEVEVADVEGDKFGAAVREKYVDYDFDKFKRGDFGVYVT